MALPASREYIQNVRSFISTTFLLALWIAAMLALNLWCDSTQPPCDPQTNVNRCEPELGNYLR